MFLLWIETSPPTFPLQIQSCGSRIVPGNCPNDIEIIHLLSPTPFHHSHKMHGPMCFSNAHDPCGHAQLDSGVPIDKPREYKHLRGTGEQGFSQLSLTVVVAVASY